MRRSGVRCDQAVDRVTIYFKDGQRVEFYPDEIYGIVNISVNHSIDGRTSYDIELENSNVIRHTKRTSKRYVKNRRR